MAAALPSELNELIEEQMTRWSVPGVAVGILRDGEVVSRGFGVASIETNHPIRPDTLFQVGSISKVFTATLVMRLVDEGMLDLDAPLTTWLPGLRLKDAAALKVVNLRQLLSHTSGIYGDYFKDFGWGDDALRQAIVTFDNLDQLYEPGEMWAYANSGFNLAGRVAEAALDKPFETAMRELVFSPLGLEHSFYYAHEAIVYPVAVGHTIITPGEDAVEVARHYPLPRVVAPAGGIISTVGDLLTFARFHMGDGTGVDGQQVLSAASIQAMQAPHVRSGLYADAWGIGWDISTVGGAKVVGHGGSTNGFQARLSLVPEQQFAVAILTNGSRGSALHRPVVEWTLEHEHGLKKERPPIVNMSDEQLRRYAGRYETLLGSATVSVADGGLRVVYTSRSPLTDKEVELPPMTMQPIGDDEFMTVGGESDGSLARFLAPAKGRPMRLHTGRLLDKVEEE